MSEIPARVAAFIREHIHSVDQLEMLLLLRSQSDRTWTANELSVAASNHRAAAAAYLADFTAKGFVAATTAKEPRFQYRAATKDIEEAIQQLVETYAQYRVRIITLIYSKPTLKVQTFADAFKLRKDDE